MGGQNDDVAETVTLMQLISLGTKRLAGREVQHCISQEVASGKSLQAILSQKNAMGWQPLLIAAQKNMSAVVETLLEMGADVECEDAKSGWTPLMHAVVNGNEQIVKCLLANNAHINKFTKDDWNPLSAAIMHERLQIIDILVDAGACINTIKRRHPFAHEQYLHAQQQSEARKMLLLTKTSYALYVRDYDQYV